MLQGKADLYSVNVPLVKGMSQNKVLWTSVLENRWESRSCFEEVIGDVTNAKEEEEGIREAEGNERGLLAGNEGGRAQRQQQKHFKWSPRFQDVYRSVERSGEGNDGRTIMEHDISVTPLKANFMHSLGKEGEIKLLPRPSEDKEAVQNLQKAFIKDIAVAPRLSKRLTIYVNYEDVYVQPLIFEAIESHFPPGSYTLASSPLDLLSPLMPYLHIGAYEFLPFEHILSQPRTSMTNAYIIRKALIRKHYLSNTVESWIAKHPDSILATNVKPSCSFELDYAEFLDDALVEAWELKAGMEGNEGKPASEREWWILKPGMSDRGQGIRLFSTVEELQAIFEQWEAENPDSDGEYDEDDTEHPKTEEESDAAEEKSKDYIITSHLRHFLAQPYIHPPLLLPDDSRKFHIRTYVLAFGALKVYVYKPMLALFSSKPYVPSWSSSSSDIDLAAHLTNTCLRTSSSSSSTSSTLPAVSLLSSLTLPTPIALESIETQIFALTAEIFEAAARSQSIHFQPLQNCFEVFGLDFLVDADGKVWLLECNAFPDFGQTGADLRGVVGGFWEAVMALVGNWWGLADHGVDDQSQRNKQRHEDEDEDLVLVREVDLGRR